MEKKKLKLYEMKEAKKTGLCLDWLHNRCVYPGEECRFLHQLPPRVKRKERAKARVSAARKPRVQISGAFAPSNPVVSLDNQTTSTSICEEMSTGSSFPECSTDTLEEFVEVPVVELVGSVNPLRDNELAKPQVHMPTDYVPTTLEPPVLSLNADAREYAPTFAPTYAPSKAGSFHSAPTYAPSNAGSFHSAEDLYNAMSTSHTPAPSVQGSVHGEPTYYTPALASVPTLPNLQYQTYIPHPHTVAMQNLNAQLAAQVNAFKASQEQVHQYKAELTKMQRETEIMMRHHEKAMKQLAFERSQQQALYEQQLGELRKQTVRALDTAKVQEHRAMEHAARVKELESREMEVVTQPAVEVVPTQPAMEVVTQRAVVVQEQSTPAHVVFEEVVMPKDTTTFFCSTPITSLVPAMEVAEIAAAPKSTPAKAFSEREPEKAAAKVLTEPERRMRKRRGRRTQVQATPAQNQVVAEEPVAKPSETPVMPAKTAQVTPEPCVVIAEAEPVKPAPKPVKVTPAPVAQSSASKWSAMRKSAPVQTRAAPPLKMVACKPCVAKKRCIFEIYDKDAIRKAGICRKYLMGLCKSEDCACWKIGCRCPEGRAHHAYKQQAFINCEFYHELPKVKRTKQLSSEERKYRERKLGVKKTRKTKRDRFNRANRRSIEEIKRRAQF